MLFMKCVCVFFLKNLNFKLLSSLTILFPKYFPVYIHTVYILCTYIHSFEAFSEKQKCDTKTLDENVKS